MNENYQEELPEEGGVSIKDIFRTVGKKIWWVIVGSVILAVAAALIFMFMINPGRKISSKEFRVNFPFSNLGKYSDGSAFNYREIVSEENLQRAIHSNKAFFELDAEKLVKNEAVSISMEKENTEKDPEYIYTITLKNYYFKDVDTEEFIDAMSQAFASFIAEKALAMNYKIDDDTFKNASFKDQLALLDQQKEIILSQYNNWISQYNSGYTIDDKKSLGNYRTETMITFADNVRTPIENELKIRGFEYFNADVTGEAVRSYVDQLESQIELNDIIIENLQKALKNSEDNPTNPDDTTRSVTPYAGSSSSSSEENSESSSGSIIIMPGDSNLSQRLAYYIEQNAIFKQQVKYLRNGKDGESVQDSDYAAIAEEIKNYEQKLTKQKDELNKRGDELKSAIATIYRNDTFFKFSTQRASSQGGTSTVLVCLAVFVVSFIVLFVVAYVIGRKEEKKKNAQKAVVSDGAEIKTEEQAEEQEHSDEQENKE